MAKFDEHGVEGSLVVEGNRDDGAFGSGWEISCQSPLWVGESNENMPDARLIAAAPDLLAEVKRLRAALSECLWLAETDGTSFGTEFPLHDIIGVCNRALNDEEE